MLIYLQMLETPEEKSLFEQIYLEYCGLMFHVAYEILHNEQDAEDAVHQAFVKIAENIKKIDAPVCPKTHSYVVTIVEHQAIDQYRRLQKHPSVELIEEIQGTNAHYEGDNDLTKYICQVSRNDFVASSSGVLCQRNCKDVGAVVAGRNQTGSTSQKQIEKTM